LGLNRSTPHDYAVVNPVTFSYLYSTANQSPSDEILSLMAKLNEVVLSPCPSQALAWLVVTPVGDGNFEAIQYES
jgi:hypothetical protein